MTDRPPLGSHEEFWNWTGRPRDWGVDGRSKVWFGGQLPQALQWVLDEHLRWARTNRSATPAVLGAVPWFEDMDIALRLAQRHASVVVSKIPQGHRSLALIDFLNKEGVGFPARALWQFAEMGVVDEAEDLLIGPYDPLPSEKLVLDPVRVVGYRGPKKERPIPHIKMMVLGDLVWHDEDALGNVADVLIFRPWTTWLSSANWTEGASLHVEFGIWSHDRELSRHALDFMCALLKISEPVDADTPAPTPHLVDIEYDNEAMAEAARFLEEYADDVNVREEPGD